MRRVVVSGVLAVMVIAGRANAGPITGSSSGSFNDVSGSCGVACSVSGGGTQLDYGVVGSHLNAVNVTFDTTTPANDVAIAQLTWTQNFGDFLLPFFAFDWATSFDFTAPLVGTTSEEFNMDLATTLIGPDRVGIDLGDLVNLSAALSSLFPGTIVSDVKFAVTNSTLIGNIWMNEENSVASLFITADFEQAGSQPVPAPEPASMFLVGSGLLGIRAAVRRRRATKS